MNIISQEFRIIGIDLATGFWLDVSDDYFWQTNLTSFGHATIFGEMVLTRCVRRLYLAKQFWLVLVTRLDLATGFWLDVSDDYIW